MKLPGPRFRHALITLAAVLVATLGPTSVAAPVAVTSPSLSVQLVVQGGKVVIDAASTSMPQPLPDVYARCGLSPDAMRQDLVQYLEPLLLGGDKLLTRVVIQSISEPDSPADHDSVVRDLEALAKTDRETSDLWDKGFAWTDGPRLLKAWEASRRAAGSRLVKATLDFSKVYDWVLNNSDYANGPLKPKPPDAETGADRMRVSSGIAEFELAPPLVNAATKLRPTYNVKEWDELLPQLGDDVLGKFECKLWYAARIESAVQDFLEVRGISLQPYRTAKDVKDAGNLGTSVDRPGDRAALRLERPDFRDKDYGGRIHLDPDPLLEAVYIQAGPEDGARIERALYLMLPTGDFDRIRAAPGDYLCLGKAVWVTDGDQPQAVQLPLDGGMAGLKGGELAVTRIYMTRSVIAQRLQQLSANGFDSRFVMTEDVNPPRGAGQNANLRRRLAVLAVTPQANAADLGRQRRPQLPACSTRRDAKFIPPDAAASASPGPLPAPVQKPKAPKPDEAPRCSANDANNPCVSPTLTPPGPAVQPRMANEQAEEATRRNHLEFSVARSPGKPWRLGTSYRHEGLNPDDTFAIGFGEQKQASGDFSYSGDFVNLAGWGRRVQWTARAYSTYDPEVGTDASRPDERREGAELRVAVDLWRNMRNTSAQLGLGLRRVDVSFDQVGSTRQRVSAADASLVLTRTMEGTFASPRQELVFNTTRGRSDGESFHKEGLSLAARQFVDAFSQWALRARAERVSTRTPLSEWVRFGGEDSVRGYSTDRTTARQAWAIQNEYWMPLPWTPESPTLASTLRQNASLAAFIDVGCVSRSSTEFSGRKAGIGLGLRYRPNATVTLGLDAARPVGKVTESDRRTRLYFTVTAFTSI